MSISSFAMNMGTMAASTPVARVARPEVATHPTDLKILEAFHTLNEQGVRITDPRLSEGSGVSRRTVKKRRLRMIHQGRWPGKIRQGKFPPEVVRAIESQARRHPRPTYAAIAHEVEANFGRTINPKTVERILARPDAGRIRAIQERVRDEARREFHSRHEPRAEVGIPVWQLLKGLPMAGGDRPGRRSRTGFHNGGIVAC